MNDIKELLGVLIERNGSDLHLRADSKPVIRVNRRLSYIEEVPPISEDVLKNIALSIIPEDKIESFKKNLQVDFSYEIENARFRVNVFYQKSKINIVMRYIPTKIKSFEELNLPKVLEKICEERRGLVLVTGTAGSGKSTTLASMVEYINTTRDAHIITIEDPIEFYFEDKKSIISQREIGVDTPDYITSLRHIVRQDPDVILIGEMRDIETIRAALTSAQLGNLVLSTIHTINTYQTITRILDMFPTHEQNQIRFMLSDTLKAVISQRLLPLKDGSGMIPAVEVLIATPLIRKLIEENNLSEIHQQIEKGEYYGMQSFNQSLYKLYQEGKIDLDTALKASSNPEELMLRIRGIDTSSGSKG
ncbi:MAG: type IV pili twitching motility protein PilT [Caldiserica bacterium]|nr:MAG: type IV pili twitching motility protein PilT [Caldisericota bacterium]